MNVGKVIEDSLAPVVGFRPRQFLSFIGSDPRCGWPLLSSWRWAELLSLPSTITQPPRKNRRMKKGQKRHVLPRDTSDLSPWLVTRENEILIFLVRTPRSKIGILKRS